MKLLFCVFFLSYALFASASDDENYQIHWVSSHSHWSAYTITDIFEDAVTAWYAEYTFGDDGRITFHCPTNDDLKPELRAFVDNMFAQSIGTGFMKSKPILAKIKVGDNSVVETQSGEYPNTVVRGDEFRPIYMQMVAADGPENQVRIRTTHGSEQHTFVFQLGGFADATAKVLQGCGRTGSIIEAN